jgi:penicillin-binding protein
MFENTAHRVFVGKGEAYMKQSKESKPSKKSIWRKLSRYLIYTILITLYIGLLAVLFTGGVAAGFLASKVQDEPIRDYNTIASKLSNYNQTGEAYFGDDEFIGYLRTSLSSEPVQIDQVSPNVIHALLAVEDNEFYSHIGIDISGLSRAVKEYFETPDGGSGGSTITQQLVKNQFLGNERSFDRKFKEMLLAMRVDNMFEKDTILESYLNIIYLGYNADGKNIEGIQAAAKGIFDVNASELNVPQSAFIMGMINRPSYYTPFNRDGIINDQRLNRGLTRMAYVLQRMLETNRITASEYSKALEYNVRANLTEPKMKSVEKYPFLTFEIEDRAIGILAAHNMKQENIDPNELNADEINHYRDQARRQLTLDGFKVYTTIDRQLYEAFHELVKDEELFGPRSENQTFTYIDPEIEEKERGYLEQTAATLINNQNGAILAMVEGRDFNESQVNFATNSPRQPGSSIKPLLVYGPAMDTGVVQPASVIDDTPDFNYNKGKPMRNYAQRYYGLVTVRDALIRSHNATAYRVFSETRLTEGTDKLFSYLQKMGIEHVEEREMSHNSVALGGLTRGITVVENTAAFSTFANKGKFREPYMIKRIETMDGEVIYEHDTPPVQVFSEQTAFLMTDILGSVVKSSSGTGRNVGSGLQEADINVDVAGKTGTTNDKYDYWFVGYTPQVSLGVWLGYERNDSLTQGYSPRNQNIWVKLMEKVKEIRPEYLNEEMHFEMPDNIVRKTVCSKSGLLPSELCRQQGYLVEDYFHDKYVPTEVGDRVSKERIIIVDGNRYIAHSSTPDEFVDSGIFIKREPIDIPEELKGESHKYYPNDWNLSAPTAYDPRSDNGRNPPVISEVRLSRNSGSVQINWYRVLDNDIAGYRVYRANTGGGFQQIASIPNHMNLTYTDQGVSNPQSYLYSVTAVDIAGRESPLSSVDKQKNRILEKAQENQREPEEPEEPVQEEPVQEEPIQEEPVQEEPIQEEPVQEETPVVE